MPLPIIAGVVRVVVGGQCMGGARWANAWSIKTDSDVTPDLAGLEAIHDIFKQLYIGPVLSGAAIWSHLAVGTTIDSFQYTTLDGVSGALAFTETPVDGGGGPTTAPAEVSPVITIRTNLRGRQNRGRIFLPPPSSSMVDTLGHISSTLSGNVLAQLVAVNAALITGGARLGVLSTGPYKVLPPPAPASVQHWTPAVAFTMDNRYDVQRRRKA